LLAERLAQHRSQFGFPFAHGFRREDYAPLEKYLGQLPQAKFIADEPQYHQTDHIGWVVVDAVED
jgi:hypothetical protein